MTALKSRQLGDKNENRILNSGFSASELGGSSANDQIANPQAAIEGFWLTEDQTVLVEVTACEPGSIVLCGFIRALPGLTEDPEIAEHAGSLCGLPLLSNFSYDPEKDRWDKGEIFDPEIEQLFEAYLQVKDYGLKVRAFEGNVALGITLKWMRGTSSTFGCETPDLVGSN